jgi:hypothetical protein
MEKVYKHIYSQIITISETKPKNEALVAFSLQKNWAELFFLPQKAPAGTVPSLHGLRVLSLAWVIFGHRVHVQTDMANMNALELTKV